MDVLNYHSLLPISTSNKFADKQQLDVFQCVFKNLPYKCHKDFTVVSQVHGPICYAESVAVRSLSSNTACSLVGHELSWEIKSLRNISVVPFMFAMR